MISPVIQVSDPSSRILGDFLKGEDIKLGPHKVQEDFLSIPDEIFEALYGGAAYGGKSWILTMLPLFRGFYKYRGFKGIVLRRKFPDLEREIIRLSKEWYPATGGKYNEQKHSWEWSEYGSYMDFGHVQHSGDISMYDSAQYNYCAFDELTHFEEYPYVYMVGSRVRPGNASCNIAIARSGTNPGGIGQTFVYNRFVRPCEDGYKIIKDSKTGLTRIFIPALLTDNPYGMEFDPLYPQKLENLPEAEKKAKKYGDWHAFKGSVFTTFRPIKFPGEPNNALHVIPPFHIPEWWPRILSIDWGKRAMCYAMWGAVSPDSRVYIYRERSWTGRDIAYWASEIREIISDTSENIIHTVLCGSAWQDRGSETIADQFQRYSGLTASNSENTPGSRISGLQLVHDFLRWESKKSLRSKGEIFDIGLGNKIYRIHGPEAYESYKQQFVDEEDETSIPALQIFDSCKILIETIPVCMYSETKTEDIEEFNGDDPIDCLKFFCKSVKKYLIGEIGNMSHMVKVQNILSELDVNNDQTKFYRQMERLEARQPLVQMKRSGIISRRARRH
jgi:hypothetical protein